MQPAFAQETQHGSSHSATAPTSVPEHAESNSSASHGTETSNTGHSATGTVSNTQDSTHAETSNTSHDSAQSNSMTSTGHDGTDSHSTPTTEHHDSTMSTTSHGSESHGSDAHSTTATGAEHGGEHGGDHGGGHHTGYHPPAPFVVHVGPTSVHLNTLIMTYLVFAVLITMAFSATRKLTRKPGKSQVFFESLVDLTHGIVKTQISHNTYKYVPLIGTIFLFILVSNWLGLFPWRIIELFGTPPGFELAAPTNDLNTNGAIALIAVASYWFFGIQKKGLAHFKHYFQPIPLLFPLNAMEDVSRPLSLTFRLFGNILGGEIVIGILLFLTAPFVVTSLVVLPMMSLEVLVGFIQAFIFSILTASYIGGMVAEHH